MSASMKRQGETECEIYTNGMFLYFYDVVFRADRANAVEGTHQKINSVSGWWQIVSKLIEL